MVKDNVTSNWFFNRPRSTSRIHPSLLSQLLLLPQQPEMLKLIRRKRRKKNQSLRMMTWALVYLTKTDDLTNLTILSLSSLDVLISDWSVTEMAATFTIMAYCSDLRRNKILIQKYFFFVDIFTIMGCLLFHALWGILRLPSPPL